MVAVLGAPNVGKSSLINVLLGTDLTVVTSKPQTTRNKFHCVFTVDRTEIVMVDTPGLHKSSKELNRRLNEQAREGTEGADLNLLLIDISREILGQFVEFKENIEQDLGPTWVVFTKADKVENAENLPLAEVVEKAKEIFPSIENYFLISNKEGTNIHQLTGAICDRAQPGPHLYPNGDLSNKNQRFFVTEYIREQAFELLRDEVPYDIAVVIDEYKEIKSKVDPEMYESHISASILVNRPSQRAIVIGSKGSMIKEIGMRARKKIELMTGGPVHLNLHAKVSENWMKNNFVLEEIGLPRAKDSARVWRKK
jgi:GTP-binding protein Era